MLHVHGLLCSFLIWSFSFLMRKTSLDKLRKGIPNIFSFKQNCVHLTWFKAQQFLVTTQKKWKISNNKERSLAELLRDLLKAFYCLSQVHTCIRRSVWFLEHFSKTDTELFSEGIPNIKLLIS